MKPTKKDRKKFDLDLKYGSIREDRIAEMLTNKKIEVKSERDTWAGTNNICIEYESWGKPSGIRATEADYWFHNLCIGDEEYCTLVFKTVSGGDHKASKMFLVNLPKLFSSDVIKAFKELEDDDK